MKISTQEEDNTDTRGMLVSSGRAHGPSLEPRVILACRGCTDVLPGELATICEFAASGMPWAVMSRDLEQ